MKRIDHTGQRIGRWFVLEYAGEQRWHCRCDCGHTATVKGTHLRSGGSTQCKACSLHIHRVHGGCSEKLYGVWEGMNARCRSPTNDGYKWYGRKGVSVCDEWRAYSVFREWAHNNGYALGLTIDRINSDGNYEPSNCRWITNSENVRRALAKRYGYENRTS